MWVPTSCGGAISVRHQPLAPSSRNSRNSSNLRGVRAACVVLGVEPLERAADVSSIRRIRHVVSSIRRIRHVVSSIRLIRHALPPRGAQSSITYTAWGIKGHLVIKGDHQVVIKGHLVSSIIRQKARSASHGGSTRPEAK